MTMPAKTAIAFSKSQSQQQQRQVFDTSKMTQALNESRLKSPVKQMHSGAFQLKNSLNFKDSQMGTERSLNGERLSIERELNQFTQ